MMGERLYVPKHGYVDLEVFVGPAQQIKRPSISGSGWESLGSGYRVFVNYARVGTMLRKDFVMAIGDDLPRIWTKEAPEGEEGPALSKEFFQAFGAKLFGLLFKEELEAVYRDRLRLAWDSRRILRLTLCFDDPALGIAPWEYLFDPDEELFLAASRDVAFSRRVPTTGYAEPFTVTEPLRLLVAISNPSDLEDPLKPLNVEEEQAAIEEALKDCKHIRKRFLLEPSTKNLRESLREFRPNIFHFIGHGIWREGRPHLVITNEDNRMRYMDEDMFRDLLRGQDELKVMFLSACRSGEVHVDVSEVGIRSPVGLAPELLKSGIPAVLAMQHPVTIPTARRFASHFYQALANEDPIDAAVNLAREDLRFEVENRRDFGTPVLYTLIPRLFKLDLSLFQRLLPSVGR
jgi:hypothetical protein